MIKIFSKLMAPVVLIVSPSPYSGAQQIADIKKLWEQKYNLVPPVFKRYTVL